MKTFMLAILTLTLTTACGSSGQGFSRSKSGDEPFGPSAGGGTVINGTTVLPLITSTQLIKLQNDYIPQIHKSGQDNRYSSALFGIAREMVEYSGLDQPSQLLQISTPYLKNGQEKLPVQFYRSPMGKAPLAIILNPLYSGEFEDSMTRFLHYFRQKQYHVLVFMNPWSPDIIQRSPNFMPGDVWTEAQMHLQAIDVILDQHLGRENVKSTTLVGLSYGAFLSSVLKSYDQQRAKPLINGPTLLMSPPHDIFQSLKNIDRQVASVTLADQAACAFNGGFVNVLTQATSYSDYNQTQIDERCAKNIFVGLGFNATLLMALNSMNTSKNLGLTATQIYYATYEHYMQNIAKLRPAVGETDLGYWMNRARQKGYDGFITVISRDDNINEGNSLSANAYYSSHSGNTILLPTGGHTGFREAKSRDKTCGKDWTTCMLNAIYP